MYNNDEVQGSNIVNPVIQNFDNSSFSSLGIYALEQIYVLLRNGVRFGLSKEVSIRVIETTLQIAPGSLEQEFFNYTNITFDTFEKVSEIDFYSSYGMIAKYPLTYIKQLLIARSAVSMSNRANLESQQHTEVSNDNNTSTLSQSSNSINLELRSLDAQIQNKITEYFFENPPQTKKRKNVKNPKDFTLSRIVEYISKQMQENKNLKDDFWKVFGINNSNIFNEYIHQFLYQDGFLDLPKLKNEPKETLLSAPTIKNRANVALNRNTVDVNIYSLKEIYQISKLRCNGKISTTAVSDYLRLKDGDLGYYFAQCVGIQFEKFRKLNESDFNTHYGDYADLSLEVIRAKRKPVLPTSAAPAALSAAVTVQPAYTYYPKMFNFFGQKYGSEPFFRLPNTIIDDRQFQANLVGSQIVQMPQSSQVTSPQNNDNNTQTVESVSLLEQQEIDVNLQNDPKMLTLKEIHQAFYPDKNLDEAIRNLGLRREVDVYPYIHQFIVYCEEYNVFEVLNVSMLKKQSPKELCKSIAKQFPTFTIEEFYEEIYNSPIMTSYLNLGERTLGEIHNASQLRQKGGKYYISISAIEHYLRAKPHTLKPYFFECTGVNFDVFRKCDIDQFCRENDYRLDSTLDQVLEKILERIRFSSSVTEPHSIPTITYQPIINDALFVATEFEESAMIHSYQSDALLSPGLINQTNFKEGSRNDSGNDSSIDLPDFLI